MRSLASPLVLLAVAACGPEDLAGRQVSVGGLHEVSHVVTVRFDEGAASLRVVRQVRNDGSGPGLVSGHRVLLPDGAVATALRLGRNGELPAAGVLTTTEAVAERWAQLTGPGLAEPAPIGKLEWDGDGALALDLFGLSPGETVTIAYDVLVPPRYEGGAFVFEFPREEADGRWLPPRFERADAEETEHAFLVRQQHHTQPVADVRWGTSPLDVDRTLWRLEIDAALELERAPVAPNVVFVVDASHSEGAEGIAAQLELLAPYLRAAPDARVEVVLTRRFAERLFGRFVPAQDVARTLAAVPPERLAPGNGSNLEVGAALAAKALSEVGGVGRLVLFTDELVRAAFTNEAAIAALSSAPAGTVAHVVARAAVSDGRLLEQRDDDAPLASVAAATGGVFLRVVGSAADVEGAAITLRGLVRPVRVDDFEVTGVGLPDLDLEPTLNEGAMVRLHGVDAAPPERITVTGKIWAREFRKELQADGALSKRLPGLAIGHDDLRTQLTDDELRSAAFLAQAVSPVTSFFCAPAAAAPSTAGVAEGLAMGRLHLRSIGCGGWGTSSRCGGVFVSRHVDLEARLKGLLAPGVAACEAQLGQRASARVAVEATRDEVVDVSVTAPSADMAACLTEAAWALRLDDAFHASRTYVVDLVAFAD